PVYSWAPAAGLSATNTLNTTATPTSTSTYTLTVTDACGCAGTASSTITVNPGMTANSAAPDAVVCLNQVLNPNIIFNTTGATGIGAVSLPAGLVASFSGNATAGTITISGTPTSAAVSPFAYSVALAGGCGAASATGTITFNTQPTVSANTVNFNSVCAGPIASESATPAITLTLTPSTATANWSLYAGTTATGVPIQTGTGNPNYAFTNNTCSNQSYVYQVTPTLSGCNGTPLIINITVLPKPLSTFTITPNPICVGQTATLTYTSPTCPTSSFNWESTLTPPNGYVANLGTAGLNPSATNAATVTVTPSVAGTYTIRVQSTVQSGCTGPMSPAIALVVNPLPAAAGVITGTATVCQGQNSVTYTVPAIANATGYTWTLPTGASIASGNNTNSITVNFSNTATSGNITVQGNNSCGAGTVSANYAVIVNPPNTAAPSSNSSGCLNASLTPITIATTGATGIGTANGLPAGVSASWASNTITISGTPTAAGTFNYSIPLTGGCGGGIATGTIIINDILDYVNLQFPRADTICAGTPYTIYGQLYNNAADVNTIGAGV
ncbi:MAG: hypothetical protein ACKOW8_03425, partial [Flavobacteriales bacterium]